MFEGADSAGELFSFDEHTGPGREGILATVESFDARTGEPVQLIVRRFTPRDHWPTDKPGDRERRLAKGGA